MKYSITKTKIYTILVVDYDDATCADVYSDGEIDFKFVIHSEVPHKMKKGGQSAKRFSQIRDNEITKWFKRINEYLKVVNKEVYLGISPIYQKRFLKTLSTINQKKFKEISKTEYANESGIYQYINKLEAERSK